MHSPHSRKRMTSELFDGGRDARFGSRTWTRRGDSDVCCEVESTDHGGPARRAGRLPPPARGGKRVVVMEVVHVRCAGLDVSSSRQTEFS